MLDPSRSLFVVSRLICWLGVVMVVPATINCLAGTPPQGRFSIAVALSLGLGPVVRCSRTAGRPWR
jgi:hypothetical protein